MKPCLDCKKPTKGSRCTECKRKREQARGSASQRGYGSTHRNLRANYQRRMDQGETFDCWRCAELGKPHTVDPNDWHLGHSNTDPTATRGPQCSASNLDTYLQGLEQRSTP